MYKNGQNVYFTHLYTIMQELMWMLRVVRRGKKKKKEAKSTSKTIHDNTKLVSTMNAYKRIQQYKANN